MSLWNIRILFRCPGEVHLKLKPKQCVMAGLMLMAGLVFKPTFVSGQPEKRASHFADLLKRGTLVGQLMLKPTQSMASKSAKTALSRRGRWQNDAQWKFSSRGGFENYAHLDMEATAYDPGPMSCGPRAAGYTYTGMRAGYGLVAVDPRVIPLHTRLYVPGYGEALAEDIGSAIKGNRIDLGFDTYHEAIQYGRRMVRVYILGQ